MDWKETVTSMSSRVFPGLSNKVDPKFFGNEVLSNLPLQMSLYFNVILAPFWICILGLFLKDNYHSLSEIYRFITITVLSTTFLVELIRLYLGYKGNLEDKIPELAGFWMLSLLLQLPLQSFLLLNPHTRLYIAGKVIQAIMVTMLFIQLISSYCALKYTARQQTVYFKIMKLKSKANVSDAQKSYKIKEIHQD